MKKFLSTISVLAMLMAAGMAHGQILFSDTFTGMDGSRPPYWVTFNAPVAGFWYLQNGQFVTGNGDDIMGIYSYAVINVPGAETWTDYQVQADVWMLQANGKTILVGRWQDVNNHYEGYVETYQEKRVLTIEKVSGGNRITLAKAVDGVGGISIPPIEKGKSPADSRRFVMSFRGNQISLSYADAVSINATDAEFPRGSAGIGQWDNLLFFDNVVVQNLGAPVVAQPIVPPERPMPEAPAVQTPAPRIEQAGETYRITIGTQLDAAIAQRLKSQLEGWGYAPVHMVQTDQGLTVLQGNYLSATEAERAKQFLTEEGLSPGEIVAVAGGAAELAAGGGVTVRKNYRVLVNEFSREADARNLKSQLESDGYAGVDIVEDMNRYVVYVMKFVSDSEAKKLASVLAQDGYRASRVAEVSELPLVTPPITPARPEATPAQPVVPDFIQTREEWRQLTSEQRQRVIETIQLERVLRSGDVLAQEVIDLKKRFEQLTEGQKQIVQLIREKADEENRKLQQVSRLFDQVEKAMDEQNWDRAEAYLAQIRDTDPFNPKIELKERVIKNLRQNILFEGQDKFVDAMRQKELTAAKKSAEELEQQNNLEAAISKWESVKMLVDMQSPEYRNALENIGRLRGKIETQRRADDLRRARQEYITYAIAGLLMVLIMITILIMLRSRRRDRELLRQVQELTMHPPLELAEGKAPLEIPEPTKRREIGRRKPTRPAVKEEPAPPPPEPEAMPEAAYEEIPRPRRAPEPAPVAPPEEEISIDTVSLEQLEPVAPRAPAGETEEKTLEKEEAPPEREKTTAIQMEPDILLETAPPETREKEEKKEEEPLFSSITLEGFDLGPGTSEETGVEEKMSGADVDLGIDELLSAGLPETREKGLDETQEVAPAEEKPRPPVEEPKARVAAKKEAPSPEPSAPRETGEITTQEELPAGARVLFEQNFDDEPLGEKPKNWTGDYEYATLIVSNESPAPGSKQHLKFEKKTGAGSAYYSCKFPDVTGEVEVEFDIRCDDKNKYLLGFYIEKDNDFRQSVHTIIHRTEAKAKPTLRIQGEPASYELKTWRHVRYEINLRNGTVNGYVDNELVADNIKLASPPRSLNSLSIRDNLATVGVLLIDNIRIVKK